MGDEVGWMGVGLQVLSETKTKLIIKPQCYYITQINSFVQSAFCCCCCCCCWEGCCCNRTLGDGFTTT